MCVEPEAAPAAGMRWTLWRRRAAGALKEPGSGCSGCPLKRLADWEGQQGLGASKGVKAECGVKKQEAQGPSVVMGSSWRGDGGLWGQ